MTIPIVKANLGGASNSDYSGVPANIVFNAGETSKTFSFTAAADSVDDDGESVKLTFGTLPTGVTEGTTNETTVSITDDDVPSVSVTFGSATHSVDETDDASTTEDKENEAVVTVTLSADPERTVTITIDKANLGGASSSDYSGVPASVVFNTGETSETFTFTATADTVDDDGESVKLSFNSLPVGVTEGTIKETVVSINDDDLPADVDVAFGQGSYTVAEGSSVTVTVTLSEDPERVVTIPVSKANQGGASNSDYTGVPASVVFNSGETSKTFTFTAAADSDDDDGESVKLTFGTLPDGVSEGTTKETVISITDDDVPSVSVEFGSATYSVEETDDTSTTEDKENEAVVTVTLSADPERTVTIPISKANQSQASSADYSGVPGSVVFNSGETTKTFTFIATADTVDDDDESVKLTFGTLPTGVTEGTTKETVVSINDDDLPADVDVAFGQGSYTVAEGSSVTVTVTLSEDPERAVTIPVSKANQGGASNSDYSGVPASVVFNAGETSKTFSFSAASDSVDDDGESVKLTFGTTLPTGVTEGTTKETVLSITDDDVPSVSVEFGSATYSVDESDVSTTPDTTENEVTVTVTLSADPERMVTIPIVKTNQGGASNSDYSGVPATVVFNAGETSKTFSFAATSDTVDDDDESVKLTFGTLPTGVTEGTTKETVVSITDDDVPSVTVAFGAATYSVDETDDTSTTEDKENEAVVTVTLSAAPERTVTIGITTTDQGEVNQSQASSADYSGVPANVVFNSGETSKTFTFAAKADTVDDDGESVKLSFNSLPTGVTEGTIKETVVSINDDDLPADVDVEFGQATYSVSEGSTVTVKVTLSEDPERSVTIPITTTNQSGASDSDYSGVPGNVTFNSGDTEKEFSFSAVTDNLEDSGESVKLTFGTTLPTGITEGTTKETVISITNVSAQNSLTVNFGAGGYGLSEGATTTIKVTLNVAPGSEADIPLTKTEQGGISSADYSGVPSSVTFGSSDTEKSFTFSATQDTVDDDGESIKLTFNNLPSGVSEGTTKETVISITDDDVPSVTVSFGSATYSVEETDDTSTTEDKENEAVVTVTLSADPERTVTIPISKANQGGASSSDYSGVPASVVFNSGETSKTFTFIATADTVDDDDESVKLTFGTLPTGVTEGTTKETVVSINDDDVPSVTVSFGSATYSVEETDDTSTTEDKENEAVVTVTLSADPERTVTIPISKANQGGASSSDYSGVPASVVFNSGETSKTFTFAATADTVDDDDESVKLTFGTLPTGVTEGTTKETTVSINDDDVPSVTVSFAAAAYSVDESDDTSTTGTKENEADVTVTLSEDPEQTVTIPISKANQGGASRVPTTPGCPPVSSSTPARPPRPSPSPLRLTRSTTTARA